VRTSLPLPLTERVHALPPAMLPVTSPPHLSGGRATSPPRRRGCRTVIRFIHYIAPPLHCLPLSWSRWHVSTGQDHAVTSLSLPPASPFIGVDGRMTSCGGGGVRPSNSSPHYLLTPYSSVWPPLGPALSETEHAPVYRCCQHLLLYPEQTSSAFMSIVWAVWRACVAICHLAGQQEISLSNPVQDTSLGKFSATTCDTTIPTSLAA
jgi:hypothetical protein